MRDLLKLHLLGCVTFLLKGQSATRGWVPGAYVLIQPVLTFQARQVLVKVGPSEFIDGFNATLVTKIFINKEISGGL
jgi:hypothetical protein